MKYLGLILLIIFAVSVNTQAQTSPIQSNTNEHGLNDTTGNKIGRQDSERKNNLSVHLGLFDPWVGIYYERLITPYLGIDIAAGIIGGSAGVKLYYPKLSAGKFSFYSGFSEGFLLLIGAKHYVPFGLTFLGKKGLRVSFDAGPQIFHDPKEENYGVFSLKIGASF